MFNGFPALAVVVVCSLYSLGCVVGDTDTVPQEWHSCPCCSIANAIEGANEGDICLFIIGLVLNELYVEATHNCPDNSDLINNLETLLKEAAICKN